MKSLSAAVALLLTAGAVAAQDFREGINAYLANEVMHWADDAALTSAIAAQNLATASLTGAEIETLDKAWMAEIGSPDRPMIDALLGNAASTFLQTKVELSDGRISEVFITDARGLNVASSGVTSDYWQGDEAKFTETFPKGAGAVLMGDVEFDESSQTYQLQISVVIVEPGTDRPIGTMTLGLNADAF